MSATLRVRSKGGTGSGNWGHAGRPGMVGGSAKRSGAMPISAGAITFKGKNVNERREIVKNLQPDDRFQVFHGMRYIDEVLETTKSGFDPGGLHERGRVYGGRELEFEGYHVSPDMQVATGFGPFVFEMEIEAKSMIAPPGTHWDIPTDKAANEFWRSSYPNSFRPALSNSLMLAESQGLLIDKVPVANIKAVWMYGPGGWRSMSPQKLAGQIESGAIKEVTNKALLHVKNTALSDDSDADTIIYTDERKTPERANFMEKTASPAQVRIRVKGGAGSGNWGHAGRPGMVGGSAKRSVAMSIATGRDWQMRQAIAKARAEPKEPEPDPWGVRPYIKAFVKQRAMIVNEQGDREELSWEQAEVVEGWLAKHPAAFDLADSGALATIRFAANQEQFENLHQTPAGTADAFYSRTNRMVVMRATHLSEEANVERYGEFNGDWGQKVFHHEVGHAVDQMARFRGMWAETWFSWYDNPDFDRHTAYSKTSATESFAESYSSFIMNEGRPPGFSEQYAQPGSYGHTFESVQMFTDMIAEAKPETVMSAFTAF